MDFEEWRRQNDKTDSFPQRPDIESYQDRRVADRERREQQQPVRQFPWEKTIEEVGNRRTKLPELEELKTPLNSYIFIWDSGKHETLEGVTPEDALDRAGYGRKAIKSTPVILDATNPRRRIK